MRRIAEKIIAEHPGTTLGLIIDYANSAMPHTIEPEDFTLTIMAFGAQQSLRAGNYDQQSQTVKTRIDLMTTARHEYENILSQLRLQCVVIFAPPNEAVFNLTRGDEVLVYRKKQRLD